MTATTHQMTRHLKVLRTRATHRAINTAAIANHAAEDKKNMNANTGKSTPNSTMGFIKSAANSEKRTDRTKRGMQTIAATTTGHKRLRCGSTRTLENSSTPSTVRETHWHT